ncbi:hypothetical protein OG216_04835 [Streptomycetaceae bacterium NBC_01309]
MRRIWGGAGAGGLGVRDVLMKDARLSVPARGLAVHLLLLPEHAQPDRARLASRPGESVESIEGYLEELEEVGYLRRRIVWDRRGRQYEEVTVFAQAVAAGAEAADVRGRVFHWLAAPERQRERASAGPAGGSAESEVDVDATDAALAGAVDAAQEVTGGATGDVIGSAPGDVAGDDVEAVAAERDTAAAEGAAPGEAERDNSPDDNHDNDLADGDDRDGDNARPEPVPAGACSGGGVASGAARP